MPREPVLHEWRVVIQQTDPPNRAGEMAQLFHVSETAMRIRLESLDLTGCTTYETKTSETTSNELTMRHLLNRFHRILG